MVALSVYVLYVVVWFSVGFVGACCQVECYVQEVDCLSVGVYCDFQVFVFESCADGLLKSFYILWGFVAAKLVRHHDRVQLSV